MNIVHDIEKFESFVKNLSEEYIYKTFSFSDDTLNNYKEKLDIFIKSNSSTKSSNKEKKESLEHLVSFIANKTNLFTVHENVKTSTNEIDLLLTLKKPTGSIIFEKCILSNDDTVLLECKNYNKKIDVTWIGKFYSLLRTSKTKLGVIFSYNGFTGEDWKDGTGLAKKIFLTDNTLVLDFSLEDFQEISNGTSILKIIKTKIQCLKNDTLIHNYISKHPLEGNFQEK